MSDLAMDGSAFVRHDYVVGNQTCLQSRGENLPGARFAGIEAIDHTDKNRRASEHCNRAWFRWRGRCWRWSWSCGGKGDGIHVGKGIRLGLAIRPEKFDLTSVGP